MKRHLSQWFWQHSSVWLLPLLNCCCLHYSVKRRSMRKYHTLHIIVILCVMIPYRLYAVLSQLILLLQNTPSILQYHWKMQYAKKAYYVMGISEQQLEYRKKYVIMWCGMWCGKFTESLNKTRNYWYVKMFLLANAWCSRLFFQM